MSTIKIGKNKYRTAFSFTAAELNTSLKIEDAGIAYQMPDTPEEVAAMREVFGYAGDMQFPKNPNIPSDLMPKPEDFVQIPFRLLSATTVAAGTWRATDFSNENLLKASLKKLEGKPVYTEHNTSLDNWLGMVQKTTWSEATVMNGTTIPAGINGMLAIDAKSNPKILRGILAKGIFSNSVTVVFDWKPSHTFEDEYTFRRMVGSLAEDGNMIRRVVTAIHDYYESSLVFLGADPYAKLIDEGGNLVNVDKVNTYKAGLSLDSDLAKSELAENKMVIPTGLSKEVVTLSSTKITKPTTPNDIDMKKEVIDAILSLTGLKDVNEVTVDVVNKLTLKAHADALEGYKATAEKAMSLAKQVSPDANDFEAFSKAHTFVPTTQLEALKATEVKVTTLEAEVTTLKADKESLATKAALADSILDTQRKEVERLYKANMTLNGTNPNESVLGLIGKATMEELDGLAQQYGGNTLSLFKGKCEDCGSEKLSFQSSKTGEDEGKTKVVQANKSASLDDIRAKFTHSKVHA